MAAKMMGRLIQGLKEIYGTQFTDEQYEAMLWEGLHETVAYQSLTQTEKDEIGNLQSSIRSNCGKTCK